jgi:hypothetical protein
MSTGGIDTGRAYFFFFASVSDSKTELDIVSDPAYRLMRVDAAQAIQGLSFRKIMARLIRK